MLKSFFHPQLIEVGLDEVGRGCLAGPVVAAGVILPKNFSSEGLRDSKELSPNQRLKLAIQIKKEALAWAVVSVDNQRIDEVNISQATFDAMHQVIEQLVPKPEHILVDGNRFRVYDFIPHTCIIKGDNTYFSIAAASVLAKVYRDEKMTELAEKYPFYHWQKNKGYPTKDHKTAIEQYGLTEFHRKTYKCTK